MFYSSEFSYVTSNGRLRTCEIVINDFEKSKKIVDDSETLSILLKPFLIAIFKHEFNSETLATFLENLKKYKSEDVKKTVLDLFDTFDFIEKSEISVNELYYSISTLSEFFESNPERVKELDEMKVDIENKINEGMEISKLFNEIFAYLNVNRENALNLLQKK